VSKFGGPPAIAAAKEAIVAALIACATVGTIGLISERFWRVVATYARTGALPADLAER
jgi:hypothetical protein